MVREGKGPEPNKKKNLKKTGSIGWYFIKHFMNQKVEAYLGLKLMSENKCH